MQLLTTNLHLVDAMPSRHGLAIYSPAAGVVHPLSLSPHPAAAQGFLGAGITLQLQGNQLKAPFDGLWSYHDRCGQHLMLQHPNGLRFIMLFPPVCLDHHGIGFEWHVPSQTTVQRGQTLLTFDCALMTQWQKPFLLTLLLPQHEKFQHISCRPVYHDALHDLLFLLEAHPTQHGTSA